MIRISIVGPFWLRGRSRFTILGFLISGHLILPLDRFIDFLPMNLDVPRSVDAEPDVATSDIDDSDLDVVADHDRLISIS